MANAVLKRVLLGQRLSSHKLEHQLLPKFLALPVFSSDPLSSNAYATEEMMLVLVLAGAGALSLMLPISFAIAALLIVVVTSYRQTVRAYPRGGGSYIVARENLGTLPGLIAAAAILSDYVLTVAVSVTAGTIAVTSAAPRFGEYRVPIAVALVALLTLANLRGVREAGQVFAIPTYGFVAMVYVTLLTGFVRCLSGCPQAESAHLPLQPVAGLAIFLVLRAFSSGATALTGVEAIADGVQAFRRPQSRNAATTLSMMAVMTVTMFLGITLLARNLNVRVTEEVMGERSVLAQIGHAVFGGGPLFLALQAFTALILILAANTAYQDFPRLSAILARDRFMPSQFKNRGDRLVFSNGVIVLAILAIVLIYLFDAQLTRLIQLYVVGVFTAFTLSQAGMVRRWLRLREGEWRRSMIINGIGAATTGVVLVIVAATKFVHGAWIVIAAMPVIVSFFLAVHRHYESVGRMLRSRNVRVDQEAKNSFVLLVRDLGPATTDAVGYLRALRPERVIPLYIGDPAHFDETSVRWASVAPRMGRLEPLACPDGRVTRCVREYVRAHPREPDEFVTVVVPELVSGRSLWKVLLRRTGFWLKASLLFEPGVVVTDVPLLPEELQAAEAQAERPLEPERSVVLVPVSAVHDATIRALVYARALHPTELEAVFFGSDPEDIERILSEWERHQVDIPLTIVEDAFRDLTKPLLNEVRRHTARRDTIVTVVLPEFVVRRWWEHLLHNQTALFFKRVLLFEPNVVVTSIPYRLSDSPPSRRLPFSAREPAPRGRGGAR